jgi:hypothetical protein
VRPGCREASLLNLGRLIRFDRRTLPPGTYVYTVRLTAAMNPERTSVIVSRPFRVLGRR